MSSCDKFKFEKGELFQTSESGGDKWWEFPWYRTSSKLHKLIITDKNGNKIAQVNKDNIAYKEVSYVYGGDIINESLVDIDGYDYGNVKNLSMQLGKGGLIVTDSRSGFTSVVIRLDMMDVTKYGEKVLSECYGHTMEYDASASPTYNDDNHLNDYSISGDDLHTDRVSYSPMNTEDY